MVELQNYRFSMPRWLQHLLASLLLTHTVSSAEWHHLIDPYAHHQVYFVNYMAHLKMVYHDAPQMPISRSNMLMNQTIQGFSKNVRTHPCNLRYSDVTMEILPLFIDYLLLISNQRRGTSNQVRLPELSQEEETCLVIEHSGHSCHSCHSRL